MDAATTLVQPGLRTVAGSAFIAGSATLYVGSMVAMKLWGQTPAALTGLVIVLCLFGAVALEIMALRLDRMGMVYAAILGVEVVLLMLVSHFGFGERLTLREGAGVALIAAGAALAWS